jgi:hypothetical protein
LMWRGVGMAAGAILALAMSFRSVGVAVAETAATGESDAHFPVLRAPTCGATAASGTAACAGHPTASSRKASRSSCCWPAVSLPIGLDRHRRPARSGRGAAGLALQAGPVRGGRADWRRRAGSQIAAGRSVQPSARHPYRAARQHRCLAAADQQFHDLRRLLRVDHAANFWTRLQFGFWMPDFAWIGPEFHALGDTQYQQFRAGCT